MYCVLHCISGVFNQLKIWQALFPSPCWGLGGRIEWRAKWARAVLCVSGGRGTKEDPAETKESWKWSKIIYICLAWRYSPCCRDACLFPPRELFQKEQREGKGSLLRADKTERHRIALFITWGRFAREKVHGGCCIPLSIPVPPPASAYPLLGKATVRALASGGRAGSVPGEADLGVHLQPPSSPSAREVVGMLAGSLEVGHCCNRCYQNIWISTMLT